MLSASGVGCDPQAASAKAQPRLTKAAQEFEAQMMKELIRPMARPERESYDADSGGALVDFGSEMLGQSLSRAGGFGIADQILRSFSRSETACSNATVIGKSSEADSVALRLSDELPMNSSRRIVYGDPEQR